jgi:N-acetylglucosamine-6-sulfatase
MSKHLAVLVMLIMVAGTALGVQAGPTPPNIVVVVTDDMRASDWQALSTTERLFGSGTRFENFFFTTPTCCPSRTSLLTGLYAHNHGVLFNSGENGGWMAFETNGNQQRTIALRLQEAGYRTGLIGKYLNGYHGTDVPAGWDVFKPIKNQNYELTQGVRQGYVTDLLGKKAVDFVKSTPASRPLFLYFAPNAPHNPAIPAPRHEEAFAGRAVERDPSFDEADLSDKPLWARGLASLTAEQVFQLDALERRRMATLRAVDEAVAAVWGALEEEGRAGNTVVLVMSDNGYLMGQHRIVDKQAPYDSAVRVPMLAYGPGFDGGIDTRLAANIDVAPTIADIVGLDLPNVDGRSLLQRWDREAVLIEWFVDSGSMGFDPQDPDPLRDQAAAPPPYQALRTERYLYVEYATGERELYDYLNDENELDNQLADWEGHTPTADPQVVQDLQDRLAAAKDCSGVSCP